jgi:hypothetical protein
MSAVTARYSVRGSGLPATCKWRKRATPAANHVHSARLFSSPTPFPTLPSTSTPPPGPTCDVRPQQPYLDKGVVIRAGGRRTLHIYTQHTRPTGQHFEYTWPECRCRSVSAVMLRVHKSIARKPAPPACDVVCPTGCSTSRPHPPSQSGRRCSEQVPHQFGLLLVAGCQHVLKVLLEDCVQAPHPPAPLCKHAGVPLLPSAALPPPAAQHSTAQHSMLMGTRCSKSGRHYARKRMQRPCHVTPVNYPLHNTCACCCCCCCFW